MRVYLLTFRLAQDHPDYDDTRDKRIGAYVSLEAAINAAEIDAEERFGLDDVEFDFPGVYGHNLNGTKIRAQSYPRPQVWENPVFPSTKWDIAYAIEEVPVEETA